MKKSIMAAALLLSTALTAVAQDAPSVKLGVINDQSSSFSALGGTEVTEAVKLAISDFGGEVLGKPIELVSADHQNKPEVALSIAREWLERDNVDALFDVANSAIALSVNTLLGEQKKLGFFVSPMTDKMTEADCNGYGVAWAYDAYSQVRSSVSAQLKDGGESWFIISPDYEAGKVLEASVKTAVEEEGGKILGAIRAPLGTTDFSSYILQAQASGAKVVALTVNGPELVNALKQVQEFGLIDQGQRVALTVLHQSDARAIGLEALKGIQFASPWYWNTDDASKRFKEEMQKKTGNAPGWVAAGAYSAATNYLNAVKAAGTDDPTAVLAKLREGKINDMFAHNATLLPNGRLIHDTTLLEVRAPGETADPQDVFKVVTTVPADVAFRSIDKSACKLGKS
ncbi:ABC transporter substrate-binding protein [Aminobacter sp. AP02]|uniref:ABC transporter substrate-binding protein n=1 Tax=Aminobacter sp. AP02 TaxID=2135737 RepID=UPI000D6BBD6B|nr:ABC transporter substrate-binding protein [Aminobacter sp. AP02]PWK73904.1 amino acid/amide ABC transporter substrate-binding protein (HAAT family) [Aminobacter sp. AP02]